MQLVRKKAGFGALCVRLGFAQNKRASGALDVLCGAVVAPLRTAQARTFFAKD